VAWLRRKNGDSLIDGKWRDIILFHLQKPTRRFAELRKAMAGNGRLAETDESKRPLTGPPGESRRARLSLAGTPENAKKPRRFS